MSPFEQCASRGERISASAFSCVCVLWRSSVKRRNTIVESRREFADYMVCLYRSLWLCERLAEHAAESSPTLTFLFCGALIRCRPRARELAQVFCNHGL